MKIILYSTHCPKCNVLEKKLKIKNIEYEEINDVEIMKKKGFLTVPFLEVDGISMDYKTDFNYVESL